MADSLFDELNRLADRLWSPAGTFLFRRDEPSHSVYTVRSGKVALLWPDAEGAGPMEEVGPGSIVGLPAALNGVYSVTAKSLADSELGAVSVPRMIALLGARPPLCRAALRLMGEEVARMRAAIAEHCGQLRQRS